MTHKYNRLSRTFFARDTHTVAKELLGKLLIRSWRNQKLVGRITEVESYIGENDKACHASKGRTPRTNIMFGEAGHAYVYLIYGMYDCLNIITESIGFPAAVLVRSVKPITGIAPMQRARQTEDLKNLTTGPGKLTQAMHITHALNGEDLVLSNKLFIVDDNYRFPSSNITTTPRVGVDYAGKDALLPWRYFLNTSDFVSKTKFTQNA